MNKSLRTQSGFTLIELLVVIVIIGILAAIALPNFIKARNKAREAEVKSNIHSIQLALERYAVDNHGVYPTFLTGGERDSNVLMVAIEHATGQQAYDNASWPGHQLPGDASAVPLGVTPYAVVAPKDPATGDLMGQFNGYDVLEADPLLFFGYLAQYPRNPFARKDSGMFNADTIAGTTMGGMYPFGGHHGDIMFDLGYGFGDAPQTDFVLYTTEMLEQNDPDVESDPDLDGPGNFYYHPLFADGIPVYFHTANLIEAIGTRSGAGASRNQGIYAEDVLGFFLYGYGAAGDRDSLVEGGQDLFNRMPNGFTQGWSPSAGYGAPQPPYPDYGGLMSYHDNGAINHCANTSDQGRTQTTGYNSTEYDPYTGAYADGINPRDPEELTYKSGSDGINDWVIICVAAGSDNMPDTVRDTLQYGEVN